MSRQQALHNALLKRSKAAKYTQMESEELHLAIEKLKIDFYLHQEVMKRLEQIEVKEEDLQAFYEQNKERYQRELRLRVDTIFVSSLEKANKVLEECNAKNFEVIKKKYDERTEEGKRENLSELIPLSQLHPAIANLLVSHFKRGIVKRLAKIGEQYHIVYLQEREEERTASYEEAREVVFRELQQLLYQKTQEELIQSILSEETVGEEEEEVNKNIKDIENKEEL